MFDVKLGKKEARKDERNLRMANYIGTLPTPPAAGINWCDKVMNWPMYLNDKLGDCVIAGAAHMIEQWLSYVGMSSQAGVTIPTDAQVIAAYEAIGGYRPNDPETDNGCVLLDALKYWRSHGIAKHKIIAFMQVNPKNLVEVAQAIWLFGNLYTGIALPLSAQGKTEWDIAAADVPADQQAPGSWGGHCLIPGTRLLTSDLQWIPIEKFQVGDSLIGFDESNDDIRRHYRTSTIEATDIHTLPCYELTLNDGKKITSSSGHLWLTDNGHERSRWEATETLKIGSQILKALSPWDYDSSRDAGYLAAAFDGEGWLSTGGEGRGIHRIGFDQKDNDMLARVQKALGERSFHYRRQDILETGFAKTPITRLNLSDRQNLLRFLGEIRPHRLLRKFSPDHIGAFQALERAMITDIKFVGEKEVIALQTSTKTYIAEGLASHNCVPIMAIDPARMTCITWGSKLTMSREFFSEYCDEAYVVLSPDWLQMKGKTPSGFDKATLIADLNMFK